MTDEALKSILDWGPRFEALAPWEPVSTNPENLNTSPPPCIENAGNCNNAPPYVKKEGDSIIDPVQVVRDRAVQERARLSHPSYVPPGGWATVTLLLHHVEHVLRQLDNTTQERDALKRELEFTSEALRQSGATIQRAIEVEAALRAQVAVLSQTPKESV